LAKGAVDFAESRDTIQLWFEQTDPLPYNITNAGIQMTVKLIPFGLLHSYLKTDINSSPALTESDTERLFVPLLHCGNSQTQYLQSIVLQQLKTGGTQYVRVGPIISFSRPTSNIAGDVQQLLCSVATVPHSRSIQFIQTASKGNKGEYDIFF
jgi:hypothetical protein